MTDTFERLRSALADRYRVERELGQGGMATVYLAEDLKHGRQVAIKVMRPEIAAALGAERFLREIEIAARLQHPHILMLIDSGEADGQLYYVMPYVEGETLESRLERETQLPIEDSLRITREVASALGYAHEHGVIHRDIKPDNIMLTGGHAVVMDFGIGRAVSEAGGEKLTSTGMSVGTPAYMSPEQAGGEQTVDGRSDIYALGAVLYQMLTGEPPYTGATAQAIIVKSLTDPVPSARRIRQTVSPPLDAAIQKALAKTPADRFTTTAEFAEATSLQAIAAEGLPGWAEKSAPRRSLGAVLKGIRGPRRALIGVLSLIVISVAVFAGVSGVRSSGPARSIAEPAGDRIALAVLPFENLGEPDDEYFAQAMTEEFANRLTRVSRLSVIEPSSAARFTDSDLSASEIGEELGVEYVLGGSVRWAKTADGSSQVRVTPRVVRVSDEFLVWSEPYDGDLANVFELQADLAERVAGALDVALLASEQVAVRVAPTVSQEAFQEYSLGRYHHARNDGSTAVQHYEKAVEIDPDYALAYAGLADAYHHMLGATDQGGLFTEKMDLWARAEQAARRALALDSTLGAAHVSLAYVQMARDLNWKAAEEGFKRGLELDPNYAYGHSRYSFLLFATGRVDSAIVEGERALALDPQDPQFNRNLSLPLVTAGRGDEAIEAAERALALDQVTRRPQRTLAAVYICMENWDAAADQLVQAGFPPDLARLWRAALADPQQKPAFMAYLEQVDQASGLIERAPIPVAVFLTYVDERERAIDLLEQAVDDRTFDSTMQIKANCLFDPLRDEPRFQSLLRRSGLG